MAAGLCCAALAGAGCKRERSAAVSEIQVAAGKDAGRLLRGFYAAMPDVSWRWTARVFAMSLDAPRDEKEVYLEFEYGLPEELVNEVGGVTLIGTVNGVEVGRERYYKPGHYVFTRYVPERALGQQPAVVEFELDRSTQLPGDGRVIGVNAIAAGLKRYEQTIDYRLTKTLEARQGYAATAEHLQLELPAGKALELRRLFARLPAMGKLRFQGIAVSENPLDLWAMQQIVYEVQPQAIVATGTGAGGLALYLAQTLEGLGLERSRIVAVDARAAAQEAQQHFLRKKYVEFVRGEAAAEGVAESVRAMVRGRTTMVVLNAGSEAARVAAELRAYGPMVSAGSYLVVESMGDDALEGKASAGKGAREAVAEFLASEAGKGFEVDRGREMALFTRNAGGWLRRR